MQTRIFVCCCKFNSLSVAIIERSSVSQCLCHFLAKAKRTLIISMASSVRCFIIDVGPTWIEHSREYGVRLYGSANYESGTRNLFEIQVYVAWQLEHYSLIHPHNLAEWVAVNHELSRGLFDRGVFAIKVSLGFRGIDDVNFSRLTGYRFDFGETANPRYFNGGVRSQLKLPVDFFSHGQIGRSARCSCALKPLSVPKDTSISNAPRTAWSKYFSCHSPLGFGLIVTLPDPRKRVEDDSQTTIPCGDHLRSIGHFFLIALNDLKMVSIHS